MRRKNRVEYPSQVIQVEILGFNDQGIGYGEYFHPPVGEGHLGRKLTIYVPNTIPGDVVQVTVPNAKGRRKAQVAYDEIIQASPDRIGQPNLHAPRPGGSSLQYMSYPGQLRLKENLVKDQLASQGFDPEKVLPIIGMDHPYHYRNKMELTFGENGAIGMHEQGNYRHIIDWQDNLLAPQIMMAIKDVVKDWQADWQLPHYDKNSKEGLLRHLMMRHSKATGETMLALFTTSDLVDYSQQAEDLKGRLIGEFPSIESLLWIKNTDIADRTQAEAVYVLHGRDYIHDQLGGFQYRLWFDTFFQPNPTQAELMVKTALDLAQVNEDMRVLDLFCGVGTFSLPFAAKAKELAGIEIVETSIESAKRNAKDNGIDNTYFIARNAREGMAELEETWGTPDLVLLDPPRDGAGGKVMRRIGRIQSEKVVYVSCNPRSLAEDLVWLRDFGYELASVQPIDQFPHTYHMETVVVMSDRMKENNGKREGGTA